MQVGVDAVDVAAWPVTVAAVLTAVGVIWRAAVRPVIRWGRRLETTVVFVEHELKANSGKSLRDAVDRLDRGRERFDAIDGRLDRIEQRIAEQGPQQITIVGTPPTEGDQS